MRIFEGIYAVRDSNQVERCFRNYVPTHCFCLIEQLVDTAIKGRIADAQLVEISSLWRLPKSFAALRLSRKAFIAVAELLDGTVIDASKAHDLMAIMIKGAGLYQDVCGRISGNSYSSNKLLVLLWAWTDILRYE